MPLIKETERFNALSDTGKMYTIVTYQEFLPTLNIRNPFDKIPGEKIMETTESQAVKCIDETTFQIIATGEILHKVIKKESKKISVFSVIVIFSAIGAALILAWVIMNLLLN